MASSGQCFETMPQNIGCVKNRLVQQVFVLLLSGCCLGVRSFTYPVSQRSALTRHTWENRYHAWNDHIRSRREMAASDTSETKISNSKKDGASNVTATAVSAVYNDKNSAKAPSTTDVYQETIANTATAAPSVKKLRYLKDLMWVRETLEDLTAAEFACSVEAASSSSTSTNERRRRAVDYEKLLSQLNRRLQDMGCVMDSGTMTCDLDQSSGAGALAYNQGQRDALSDRLLRTRQVLIEVIEGYKIDIADLFGTSPIMRNSTGASTSVSDLNLPSLSDESLLPKQQSDSSMEGSSSGPRLYVRDDGTVDWDGALQDQAALKKFGGAVWARINGRQPESMDDTTAAAHAEEPGVVTAKIEETEAIKQARNQLDELARQLSVLEREHTALLSSAISQGQATANVNLATLDAKQRNSIRESAKSLDKIKEQVSLQTLVYELERIFTYLSGELGNPLQKGYIPLQDRLNVAEFGLLEAQIDGFSRQLDVGESIDKDVLAVVMEQLTDFKRRLGIDYYVAGLSFDGEAIRRWLGELLEKTKKTLAFYGKGCRLFWNDIVFCVSLISRAARGYTLKPREVRTIRRTFKDILTFIPFVIILLIPLSPIGHVLVFGAIQRFFPDFFPSCFTEPRQNLLQLYETAEYSEITINESLKEKVVRFSEAVIYYFVTTSKATLLRIRRLFSDDKSQ